jgi:exopolysaccharide biosynthesis polyprenyl glycosylphosphotransferase
MLKEQSKKRGIFLFIGDIIILSLSFFIAYFFRNALVKVKWLDLASLFPLSSYLRVFSLLLPLFLVTFFFVHLYNPEETRSLKKELVQLFKGVILGLFLCLAFSFLLKFGFVARTFLGLFSITIFIIGSLFRIALRSFLCRFYQKGHISTQVLLVGTSEYVKRISTSLLAHPELGVKLIGFISLGSEDTSAPEGIPFRGRIEKLPEFLHTEVVDEVIFTAPISLWEKVIDSARVCYTEGVKVRIAANFFEQFSLPLRVSELGGVPVVSLERGPTNELALGVKRIFDFLLSALFLLLFWPVFLLIGVAIKLDTPGSVFFTQERVGYRGRKFRLIKFRSMISEAESLQRQLETQSEVHGPVFKMKHDPRVTRVGRFLRRLSLDELPQFINVLKGEMSLVGPRPPLPQEVAQYTPWQRRRLSMRPGITCIWQVSGRSQIPFEKWMELDLAYIDNWSLWLDFKLLLKTLPAVIKGTGAY